MVPMRDGVRLQTVIFTPKDQKGPLPILFTRGPYGVPEECCPPGTDDILVFQNLRGRFKSEGVFVMQRPPRDRSDPKAIDESTDAYDTIDWLIQNLPNNNRRVGMFGVSYLGWTVVMALVDPHPALKAAIEGASPADMFLGDDFHHNGAFRLSYGFEYAALLETAKEADTHFAFDRFDTYDWYLHLGALSNANRLFFHGRLPTWNDFVQHPNRDEYWRKQAFASFLKQTAVPTLHIAGWWDQEDFYGPQKIYELFEKADSRHLNYFVAGPWNHGLWSRAHCRALGPIDFGEDTCADYHQKISNPWFDYWLKDKGELKQPEALTFQTGANRWRPYNAWPPREGITQRKLYFRAESKLSFDAPSEAASVFDSYVSDPAHPVPYRHRPVTPTYPGPEWPLWLVEDQRFVDRRPDVLSYETGALQEDVTVTGDIVADLFASTSGTDSDWIVKLIDVYPEDSKLLAKPEECNCAPGTPLAGYELIVADEVFRGRFRKSFEQPEAIPSNQPLEYRIDLHTNNHVFLKGHQIMVQVQSTWFPLIDRNPQKFVPNIFEAREADYQPATQRIYRSRRLASGIELPVAAN
ncbi:MAG: X-Pro dipeptidyl-peptidase [Acidobacteria bacterium]|nr:MAG: X-Pro dipeptidyl-peptidase [Acidobacteriota bacterium]